MNELNSIIDKKRKWLKDSFGLGLKGKEVDEMLHHCKVLLDKCNDFKGRDELITLALDTILNDNSNHDSEDIQHHDKNNSCDDEDPSNTENKDNNNISPETIYCYSDEERQRAIHKLGNKPEITRFKGLGEISPEEFGLFIGADIRLDPVILSKEQGIKTILEYYMGKNTPDRQQHIIQNLRVEVDFLAEEQEAAALLADAV
jgi:hypothetical protein